LARAPFTWKYLDTEFAMEFLGGFVGVAQNASNLELRPEIGWAVCQLAGSESVAAKKSYYLDRPGGLRIPLTGDVLRIGRNPGERSEGQDGRAREPLVPFHSARSNTPSPAATGKARGWLAPFEVALYV